MRVFKTVHAEQGIAGLYNGLPITVMRAAPAHALIFFSFELIDQKLSVM